MIGDSTLGMKSTTDWNLIRRHCLPAPGIRGAASFEGKLPFLSVENVYKNDAESELISSEYKMCRIVVEPLSIMIFRGNCI
ncbi:AAEL008344-PA [Aedes aegypti]|uniref:AAEL008344-PA n=1 Tax=Aedes aegypti TaxID=7159 RepID=Q16Z22_AEDAE|nr:AAEL008344-PA [Aedes aegypti]